MITVSLMIDTFFHGHEALGLAFLRQYHADLFPTLLPEGPFNQRRRALGLSIEQIRQALTGAWGRLDPTDEVRLIDNAPSPYALTCARAAIKWRRGLTISAS